MKITIPNLIFHQLNMILEFLRYVSMKAQVTSSYLVIHSNLETLQYCGLIFGILFFLVDISIDISMSPMNFELLT
jgi:hypothetical protein